MLFVAGVQCSVPMLEIPSTSPDTDHFFNRALDVYPKYDFARMGDDEFGASLGLD